MTPEIRNSIVIARSADYFAIMRTTIFALTAIAAIIQLGPDTYSAPLTMLVITTVAYGILAGGVAIDDLINLRSDMDEDIANTAYGRGVTARNLPALKMTSAILLGLTGVAELLAIFF